MKDENTNDVKIMSQSGVANIQAANVETEFGLVHVVDSLFIWNVQKCLFYYSNDLNENKTLMSLRVNVKFAFGLILCNFSRCILPRWTLNQSKLFITQT